MTISLKKTLIGLAIGATTLTSFAQNTEPNIIPAVQNWQGAKGQCFLITERINIPVDNEEIAKLATILQEDIKHVTGKSYSIFKDDLMGNSTYPGHISLELSNKIDNKEGYKVVIGENIALQAATPTGLFYASRSLLQMMAQNSKSLPKGTIIDQPDYRVRSLMWDIGRKFVPFDQMKDWLRAMSYVKMNQLHLHLNDSIGFAPGFRLEMKTLPGLANKDGHYTQAEMKELIVFAKARGIEIIPEIDAPAHASAFTYYRPDLQHPKLASQNLDLTNPDTIPFMEKVIGEICDVFESKHIHIGTDELRLGGLRGKEKTEMGELFRGYINHFNAFLKKRGKVTRIWSGYEHMPGKTLPDKDVIIDMWVTADAAAKVKEGYTFINSNHGWTYIVPNAPYYGISNSNVYNKWTPNFFSNKPGGIIPKDCPNLLGGKFHIWNDRGYQFAGFDNNEIARLTMPSLLTFAEKLWGRKGSKDFKAFQKRAQAILPGNDGFEFTPSSKSRHDAQNPMLGKFPGTTFLDRKVKTDNDGVVWKLDKDTKFMQWNSIKPEIKNTPDHLSYPWTATFDLTRYSDSHIGGSSLLQGHEVLLNSQNSTLFLDYNYYSKIDKKTKLPTQKNQGVCIVRSSRSASAMPMTSLTHVVVDFDYKVPVGKRVKLTFIGYKGYTEFYVDGKLHKRVNLQSVCPLRSVGDAQFGNTFHGAIHSATILNKAVVPVVPVKAGKKSPEMTNLLPLPKSVELAKSKLILAKNTSVSLGRGTELVGKHFISRLKKGTGWTVSEASKATIQLEIAKGKGSPEAYTLTITNNGIEITGASVQGVVRGTETLLQLMPPAVYGKGSITKITLPCLTINDAPQFAWRALMLDVSRHFQNKDTIIKLLDGMAACKFNVFHWHLTDDQGWRLPIEGYPKLTANAKVSYSRQDIREVVEHAAKLGITIMPEIDMPGHSRAACMAYPEIATRNSKGKITGTLNPGAAATYKFIEAVMIDVVKQFPNSLNIHIGADEVGTGNWKNHPECLELMKQEKLRNTHELYTYFINKCCAIVKKHDRKPFAWNEAMSSKVDPDLTILSWKGMHPGIAAAKADHDVVFCPTPQIYFDHPNTRSKNNPRAYSANASYLNHCYFFNVAVPAVPKDKRHRILGGEACLWSECIRSADHMFIMMFPRAWAIGETLWTSPEQKDWDSFLSRLDLQRQRFEAMKIPYFWEPESLAINIGQWKKGEVALNKGIMEYDLTGKLSNPGVQEFFIGQGLGEGQFVITGMEILQDGKVIDKDWHNYESSVFHNASSLFLLRVRELKGKLKLRIHVKQLFGDCAAIVQLNPALPADMYSKQCGPDTGSNRSKQTSKVVDPFADKSAKRPVTKVTTNMAIYGSNTPALTVDWKYKTFFWSKGSPKEGYHITWTFDKPVDARTIQVKTGAPDNPRSDSLKNGLLQVSKDGADFVTLSKFANGQAIGKLTQPIKAIRLKVTEKNNSWLKVQDIIIH